SLTHYYFYCQVLKIEFCLYIGLGHTFVRISGYKLRSVPPSTPRQYRCADYSARGSTRLHRKHLATRRNTMPGVMNDPEVVAYEECPLSEEQPQARATHTGFWHTLLQYVRRQRVRRWQSTSSSSHVSLHPIEMPMERLAREHLTLYLRVFTGL